MRYLKNWKTFNKLNEDAIVNDDDSMNGTGVINNGNTNPSASIPGTASTPENVVPPTTQSKELVLTDKDAIKVKEQLKSNTKVYFLEKGIDNENPKTKPFINFVQDVLLKSGYDIGVVDGQYGKKTYGSVLKFQTDKNLKVKDGKVGQETWTALLILVGLKDVKIVVTYDKKPVATKGTTQNIKISNMKKGETIKDVSTILNEQLSDLKGVSMTIDTPLTKKNDGTSFIVAKFTKDGKILNYGTDTTGRVQIPIDSTTDSIAKGIKQDLLKKLNVPTTTTQTNTLLKDYRGITDENFAWTKENVILKYNIQNQDFTTKMFKTILSNNKRDSILLLNQMLWDNKKQTLITFFNSVADLSLGYDSIMDNPDIKKAFGIVLDHIVKASNDATIIHQCIDGIGTSEDTLFYLIDKRNSKGDVKYNNQVATEYEKLYKVALAKDIKEDFPAIGEDELAKIKKFIPNYDK